MNNETTIEYIQKALENIHMAGYHIRKNEIISKRIERIYSELRDIREELENEEDHDK